jgi:methylase of polypeptide subunit release factors
MLTEDQKKRVEYVLREWDLPTYDTDHFKDIGLETFRVFRGVLPPDLAPASQLLARFFHQNKSLYQNKSVLEVGTGSGILAMVMAKHGAKSVIATDIMEACVKNTQENAERLHLSHIIDVRKGDLFEPIKEERFDLIFFHLPYLCDAPNKESGLEVAIMDDGGIIRRFLTDVKTYLKPEAKLLLPFSERSGEGNHPQTHAENYGFAIKRFASFPENGNIFVYELTPKYILVNGVGVDFSSVLSLRSRRAKGRQTRSAHHG